MQRWSNPARNHDSIRRHSRSRGESALLLAGLAAIAAVLLPALAAGAAPRAAKTVAAAAPSAAAADALPSLPGSFAPQTQRYLTDWYAFDPGLATRHGVHSGDHRIGGYTRAEINAEIARLKALDTELTAMKTFGWAPDRKVDYERLLHHEQGRLLELETVRRWERDPGYYVDLLTNGVAGLVDDPELDPAARRHALTARLELTSAVLGAALENIVNPPKPWVVLALGNTEGLMRYLADELPAALGATGAMDAGGTEPVDPLQAARASAIRNLTSFRDWLKEDILPRSSGTYALGPDIVARALAGTEGCEVGLARLEKLAVDEVTNMKIQIEATARSIDATKSSLDAGRIYSIDHPAPARLTMEAGRAYRELDASLAGGTLVEHRDSLAVRILPNPAFARPLGPARAWAPGPWEKRRGTPAIYLSLPESTWDGMRQEDHLRAFSRYALPFLLMRYGEPGRLTAAARVPHSAESRLNQALAAPSAIAGWGAYAEHVMLENGYGDKDPRLRLFQQRSALLDATRFVVTLRIHTAGMTVEQATEFLQRDGQLDRASAEREALLASRGIDGMAPLLGRAMIQKLANDVRRVRGADFTLRGFHEELMGTGGLALPLARQRLLPGDKSPPL